jgi:uncharacterized protein (TIGR00369 family)
MRMGLDCWNHIDPLEQITSFKTQDDDPTAPSLGNAPGAAASAGAVVIHLPHQRIDRVELQLVADEGDEGDIQRNSVKKSNRKISSATRLSRLVHAILRGKQQDKGRAMSDHLKEVPPAAVLLGREVISVDAKSGDVQLRFLADPQFANRHGTVQGGMLAAMLDSATGNAVMASLPPERTAVTTRLDTTFVKPAALGPLTATARLARQNEESALAEAELFDSSGQIVARARAELRVRERR